MAALINLANIHYSTHELVEAQALYERAIALEADFFEAHFNLGNIHHDLGDYRGGSRLLPTKRCASIRTMPTRTSTWRSRWRRWGCRTRRGRTGGPTSSWRRRASGSSSRENSRSRLDVAELKSSDRPTGGRDDPKSEICRSEILVAVVVRVALLRRAAQLEELRSRGTTPPD